MWTAVNKLSRHNMQSPPDGGNNCGVRSATLCRMLFVWCVSLPLLSRLALRPCSGAVPCIRKGADQLPASCHLVDLLRWLTLPVSYMMWSSVVALLKFVVNVRSLFPWWQVLSAAGVCVLFVLLPGGILSSVHMLELPAPPGAHSWC